jgi:HK97 family phage major capsid protein
MSTKIAIPTTSAELAEILADDTKRAAVFADPESAQEFLAAYAKATDPKGALAKQMAEQTSATIIDWLKDHGVEGRPNQAVLEAIKPTPGGAGAVRNAAYNSKAPGAAGDKIGFDGLGDFAKTIWHRNQRPDAAKLKALWEVQNAYSSTDPASAGFLIPEEFRSDIMQLALEQSIVRPRATVVTMGALTQSIPFVDVTTHSGSVFGGMIFYWTPESGEILTTQAKFGRVKLEANKLVGGAAIPNELYADAPALSSWLERAAPLGLAFFEDLAFLDGDGANEPLGVFNSGAKIEVAKETGQLADTIITENIFKMFSRMLPQSLGSAVWLINQSCLPQILGLTIAVGTGGAPVALVDIHASSQMSLLGRPMIVTEKVPALGNAGDISFVDFSYYLIGDRQAVSMETSEHARFMNDETMLKIVERVDGRPWVQSALTPVNGDTVSPIVTLAERA